MNLKELTPGNHAKAREDHTGTQYATGEFGGDVAIYCSGYYTVAELQLKLRLLVEARTLRADTPITTQL